MLNLVRESQDRDEYAFALGALAHFASDGTGHRMATNVSVPLLYPKLRLRFGDSITYADDPFSHTKTEFGFDVFPVSYTHLGHQSEQKNQRHRAGRGRQLRRHGYFRIRRWRRHHCGELHLFSSRLDRHDGRLLELHYDRLIRGLDRSGDFERKLRRREEDDRLGPVSYTHLDVYKRQ